MLAPSAFLTSAASIGRRGRADQRIGFGQKRAEVGIFPRLDAPMRQAEPGVCFDRLVPQCRDEGIARAGKTLASALEHVEISLLGLGAELLDRQLHRAPLSGLAAEFGVAGLLELERQLRPAGARHAPV